MTPDLREKSLLPHPYAKRGVDPDRHIDLFRRVFFGHPNNDGVKVLLFLAEHWHFFDRTLLTEEWQVQRQCFIDLLICLGVWREDVWQQDLEALIFPTEPKVPNRMVTWFQRLSQIRTKRMDMPKERIST